MMIVGVVGLALQTNWGPALTILATEPVSVLSNVDLATVPLFLLMGTFTTAAGLSSEIYNAVAAVLGHRRGGLAYATIGGSAAFGVMCGSSTATAATFAKVALPEMLTRGYSPAFSTGTIAAGGTLKSLIPSVHRDGALLHCHTDIHLRSLHRRYLAGTDCDCTKFDCDRGGRADEAGSSSRQPPRWLECPWPGAAKRRLPPCCLSLVCSAGSTAASSR